MKLELFIERSDKPKRSLFIGDAKSQEKIDNDVVGWVLAGKDVFSDILPEHFEKYSEDQDFLCIVVPCEGALDLNKKENYREQ